MITVDAALAHIFALVAPLETEQVALADAAGRVLAQSVSAQRDQPPFASSAMDGYAVQNSDVSDNARLTVIGESAAGHAFHGSLGAGQAVRIFTGAPVPVGADRVIIQEDVTRTGDTIVLNPNRDTAHYVRAAGSDFTAGTPLDAPRRLTPSDVALLASMNIPMVPVRRRPVVALIATGDELVMPGETPSPDQIIASNSFGLKALLEAHGAKARLLPIARDTELSIAMALDLASDADLIVTIGGASVGDHDLVGKVAESLGMERAFYKIAMRPGKPLMAGRMNGTPLIGLPGNPVSSMVCGHVFLLPAVNMMLGLGAGPHPRRHAVLAAALAANGPREHYMRAMVTDGQITAFDRQDSALLTVLAHANALLVRPASDPARAAGDPVAYLPL